MLLSEAKRLGELLWESREMYSIENFLGGSFCAEAWWVNFRWWVGARSFQPPLHTVHFPLCSSGTGSKSASTANSVAALNSICECSTQSRVPSTSDRAISQWATFNSVRLSIILILRSTIGILGGSIHRSDLPTRIIIQPHSAPSNIDR